MGKAALKDYAYDRIKDKIIKCKFMPGEVINERILMDELEISRTPIREAANRLEQEGYVEIKSKIGIAIKQISYNDVLEVFEVRQLLEPYSLLKNGEKLNQKKLLEFREQILGTSDVVEDEDYLLDTEMHRYFFEACQNKYLINTLNFVLDQNTRVIIVSKGNGARMHDSKKEHVEILDALLERDCERAADLMQSHLKNCREASLEYYTKYYYK